MCVERCFAAWPRKVIGIAVSRVNTLVVIGVASMEVELFFVQS